MSNLLRCLLPIGLLCLSAPTISLAQSETNSEVRLKGQYFNPSASFYDNSFGGELEGVFWLNEMFGIGLGLGYSSWDGEAVEAARLSDGGAVGVALEGDITQKPIVLSGEFRLPVAEKFSLNFSGGIGYVFIDSDVDVAAARVNSSGNLTGLAAASVDIDDAVIGRITAAGHAAVTDSVNLMLGLGYQENLSGGDLSVGSADLDEDADLSSVYGFVGVGFKF